MRPASRSRSFLVRNERDRSTRRSALQRAVIDSLEVRRLLTAFTYTGSVQTYSVLTTGTYDLSVAGAQGAVYSVNPTIGEGAVMSGDVSLTAGTTLQVVVGGEGTFSGGGGGSFVFVSGATQPLIVAGGGGGEGEYGFGSSAQTGTSGGDANGTNHGTGGTGGSGGSGGQTGSFDGGGGAGWSGNGGGSDESGEGGLGGQDGQSSTPFAGGAGYSNAGVNAPTGGYGGGGGGGVGGGGGGGGYSGGGGGGDTGGQGGGGGGGSYLDASFTNTATAVTETGNGYVDISLLGSLLVTSTSDAIVHTGTTLRDAVSYADTLTSGSPTITFDPTVFATPQTITLTQGVLDLSNINTSITINGPTAGVTVDGNNASTVFQVDSGVQASVTGFTVTDGNGVANGGNGNGGGIYTDGTLALTNDTITNNSAGTGAGIYNDQSGTLTLTDSTVSDNGTTGGSGGGINNAGGSITMSGNTVSGNTGGQGGGGIAISNGSLSITNSTIYNNSSPDNGGGGISNLGGSITLVNDTISGNSTQFGIGGGINSTTLILAINTIIAGNTDSSGAGDANTGFDASSSNNILGNGSESFGITNGVNGNEVGTSLFPIDPLLAGIGDYGGTTQTMALLPGSPAIGAGTPAAITSSISGVSSGPAIITPASMSNITAGEKLVIDAGLPDQEVVTVTGITTTTFSATFAQAHAPGFTITTSNGDDQRGHQRSLTAPSIGAYEDEGFTISATVGSGQSTPISSAFAAALGVQVSSNNALLTDLAGGQITFSAPTTGASATYSTNPITLAADGSGSTTATANNQTGEYSVTATAAGISTPATFDLTNTNAGYTLSGNVFNDLNGNGTQDAGEPGVGGVTVELLDGFYQSTGITTTTDTNGDFSFTSLTPGDYIIQVDTTASQYVTNGNYDFVDLNSGDVSGQSFGLFDTVSVSGNVFNDLNENGAQDTGEPGLSGWTVTLLDPYGFTETTQSAPDGTFSFSGLGGGTYTLSEKLKSGYAQSDPAAPGTYTFTTTSGENVVGDSFGNYIPSTSLSLSSSLNPSFYGQNVTFTATVLQHGNPVSIGTVTFMDGLATIASAVPLNASGQAAFSTTTLSAGTPHLINATYNPDGIYLTSMNHLVQTVKQATPVINVNVTSRAYNGQPLTATGTVTGALGESLGTPTIKYYQAGTPNVLLSGAPTAPGSYVVNASYAGSANYIATAVNVPFSITAPVPQFSSLSNLTIVAHTSSKAFTGIISAGSLIPTGNVTVKLNGVQLNAPIGKNGTFSATFNTSKLAVGAYTVQYTYAGSSAFAPASSSSTLNVTYGITPQFKNTTYKQGSTIPIQILLTDAQGHDMNTTNTTVAATGIAKSSTPNTLMNLPAGNPPGGKFTPDDDGDVFTLNLKTTGLTAGQYILYFTITGDPTTHSVTFTIGK